MNQLRTLIVAAVLANVLILTWLLLRTPDEPQKGQNMDQVLAPLMEDTTMQAARYDLSGRKLNLILISMDALRYDRTGFGGAKSGLTPNLDAFAKESIVFEHAVSAASWTLPSHMSVWTARWPGVHGINNKLKLLSKDQMAETSLSAGIETFPDVLIRDGWTAAGFTGGAGVSGRYGFSRGFSTYIDDRAFAGMDYSAPQAVTWLEQNRDKQFFLFLHGYDSHGQFPLPQSEIESIPYTGSLNGSIEEQAKLREDGLAAIKKPGDPADLRDKLGPDDAKFLASIYDRKVRDADQRLGTFLSQIRSLGLMDNTMIVIMSDHGDEFMEHSSIDHGHTLYEEQLHVVLLMRVPGYAKEHRVTGIARTIDIFPTLFNMLGIEGPKGVQGVSMLPMLQGKSQPITAFSETDYRLFVHQRAIREDNWKLVMDLMDGQRMLFDLSQDPSEQKDMSSSEPRRTYEMEQKLRAWMGQMGQNPQDYLGIEQKPIEIF